jgi:hypothetical protein
MLLELFFSRQVLTEPSVSAATQASAVMNQLSAIHREGE